ncbi:hypothetical protein UF75_5144 [Desulfosporosinus sp. I2]|nr:hypothetical protein [Desulfosporosinus sp. I2]KJR44461.1 hypothetical protein UF75_5144 [Desulfosporosinus sp. I2]
MIHEIHLQTKRRDEMLDIMGQVKEILSREKIQEGLIVLFEPH